MSQLIGFLSGAPSAANTTGGYYQNAANDIYQMYGPSATQYFTNEQNLALRPQFNTQEQQLAGNEAAQGITHSGAGINAFGNLGAQQAGALASADAPLFSQGLSGATGVYQQMPGAQNQAYQDAINNFYQALSSASSLAAGMPSPQPNASGGQFDSNGNYTSNTPQNTGYYGGEGNNI